MAWAELSVGHAGPKVGEVAEKYDLESNLLEGAGLKFKFKPATQHTNCSSCQPYMSRAKAAAESDRGPLKSKRKTGNEGKLGRKQVTGVGDKQTSRTVINLACDRHNQRPLYHSSSLSSSSYEHPPQCQDKIPHDILKYVLRFVLFLLVTSAYQGPFPQTPADLHALLKFKYIACNSKARLHLLLTVTFVQST